MSIWIDGIEVILSGKFIKYAKVVPECYCMITDPKEIIKTILKSGYSADIFTFCQRLPDTDPKYNYFMEWEEIAALEISTYEHWSTKQIIRENRKNIVKAHKKGIVLKEIQYTDEFVKGIVDIYNESPVRQGKTFLHYQKDFKTVKKENGTYLDKSVFIGAYFDHKLIGFVKIFIDEGCASTIQVISKIEHRDKKTSNALLAKTVEVCAHKNIKYLQYGVWSTGTLGDFKIYNGFQKMLTPRYYIPITLKGKSIIKMRLHRGMGNIIPYKVSMRLKAIRKKWHERRMF
jgi:hypothetical protein